MSLLYGSGGSGAAGGSMSKAQAMQMERIKKDEEIAEQEERLRNNMKASQRARWNESLEENSANKRLQQKKKSVAEELRLTNMAFTKVRRDQLKKMLEEEDEELKRELRSLGLTIQKDRL